jgi:antitoxin HigA-1
MKEECQMARKRLLEPIHPGEILFEEFMKPMGISINRLARDIQVSPGRISAIVNGKRAITADTALRLGKYLGTSSDLWMGLQGEFDLRMAKRTIGPEIDRCIQAHVA